MSSMLANLRIWIDDRFPMTKMWDDHMAKYYAPKNFNFWYYFGSLALLVLVNQIITGILLTMNYKPGAATAFASVEYIMREVPNGYIIRYLHAVGASAFFIVVYLHMFRGLMYGSYKKPRELIWILGMLIYVCLMAEAFLGYLLPWGNMSLWGGKVIINLFSAIPWIGDDISQWIRGDFSISDTTLNRFFAFHVIAVPLILMVLVVMHILALHEVGSNNPDGVEIKKKKGADGIPLDGIPFHPYYTVKDIVGVGVFMTIFLGIVFFIPDFFGLFIEHDNNTPASHLATPEHIKPLWYFTPFYAILRAVDWKLGGVMVMAASIIVLFFVPWLDRNPIKSIRYRSTLFKINLITFAFVFIVLGYLGMQKPTPGFKIATQVLTIAYFGFFVILFLTSAKEKTKPVPDRVTK